MPDAARPAFVLRCGAALLLAFTTGGLRAAAEPPDRLAAGWNELHALSPLLAAEHFSAVLEREPGNRAAAYGLALAVLHRQPVSSVRVREARARLLALTEAPPDDAYAQAARFQLGRIAELYADLTPGEDAAHHYRELRALAPASFHGQYAWLRLAAIELVPLRDDPARLLPLLRARVAEAGRTLHDPRCRRSFARLVAFLALPFPDGEPLALAAAREGTALGYGRWDIQEEMLALVVRLAEREGDEAALAEAIAEYRRRFPRGPRRTVVEGRGGTEAPP